MFQHSCSNPVRHLLWNLFFSIKQKPPQLGFELGTFLLLGPISTIWATSLLRAPPPFAIYLNLSFKYCLWQSMTRNIVKICQQNKRLVSSVVWCTAKMQTFLSFLNLFLTSLFTIKSNFRNYFSILVRTVLNFHFKCTPKFYSKMGKFWNVKRSNTFCQE